MMSTYDSMPTYAIDSGREYSSDLILAFINSDEEDAMRGEMPHAQGEPQLRDAKMTSLSFDFCFLTKNASSLQYRNCEFCLHNEYNNVNEGNKRAYKIGKILGEFICSFFLGGGVIRKKLPQ